MKKILFICMMLVLLVGLMTGCALDQTAEQEQSAQTEKVLEEMNNQVGMPDITEFTEKKQLKEIYELRDDSGLICYAYTQNLNGKYVYLGQVMGYGIPYATQYTLPETAKYFNGSIGSAIVSQAEPNGLYMPSSAAATWLILINEDTGEREIAYAEQEIFVYQSKLPKRLCEDWSLPSNY